MPVCFYPNPVDTFFPEADPGRKEGQSEIDPLPGMSPLVSLFSWYFAEWLLGQGAGFEVLSFGI